MSHVLPSGNDNLELKRLLHVNVGYDLMLNKASGGGLIIILINNKHTVLIAYALFYFVGGWYTKNLRH